MRAEDISVLAERLNELADVYDRRRPTAGALRVWMDMLREYPMHEVIDALANWTKRNGKMPSPHDIWKPLNEARTERIERETEERRSRYAKEAERALERNPELAERIRTLLAGMQKHMPPDRLDWARVLHSRFVLGQPNPAGLPICFAVIRDACAALGVPYSQAVAEREQRRAGVAA